MATSIATRTAGRVATKRATARATGPLAAAKVAATVICPSRPPTKSCVMRVTVSTRWKMLAMSG